MRLVANILASLTILQIKRNCSATILSFPGLPDKLRGRNRMSPEKSLRS